MFLPNPVLHCIQTLEQAGFEAYAVGGCVRDSLLGLPPHDYDLCTNALPEETASIFAAFPLVRSGEKHGTIGVVMENQVIEITTFRAEGSYQDSRHPSWVKFVGAIAEDLSRRDFTVNAMAYNPERGYIDPFGGAADLKNKILRAVGDPQIRFSEDALRILRGVRFGVRFDLTPEKATLQAMQRQASLMDKLARERVFDELCKLLPLLKAQDLHTYREILTRAVPPLAPCVGFLQCNPHHLHDVYTHTAQVVEAVPPDLTLRWAALLHDCGKPQCFSLDEQGVGHFYGHAQAGGRLAEALLVALKAPTALREQVVFLVEHHMISWAPDRKLLRRRLGKYGEDNVFRLLALQNADHGAGSAGELDAIVEMARQILREQDCLTIKDLAIDGNDLLALGFSAGKTLGACLENLLEQVQEEALSNQRDALLAAARAFLQAHQ